MLDTVNLHKKQFLSCTETGIDSIDRCLDKEHFLSYPHHVHYQHNSRGFRDQEWPDDLSDTIWCLGDSFTMGVGSPWTHTWVHALQHKTGIRCINISLDGASNAWISRQAVQILTEVRPKHLVIHWSYLHRAESPELTKGDEDRRQFVNSDSIILAQQLKNFIEALTAVENASGTTKVIYSHIPGGIPLATPPKVAELWGRFHSAGWPDVPITLSDFQSIPNFVKQELRHIDPADMLQQYFDAIGTPEHQRFIQYLDSPVCIPEFTCLDLARDGHHYDIETADFFTNQIISLL